VNELEQELQDSMRMVGMLVLRLGGYVVLSEDELVEMADPAWHFVTSKDPARGIVELRCIRREVLGTVSVSVGGGTPMALGQGELTSSGGMAALLRQVADEIAAKEPDNGS
jgi:hypothetical protein